MLKQKMYRIQPSSDADAGTAAQNYADAIQVLIDGPEDVVQILMLDAPLPSKPILLVITNSQVKPKVEQRG